MLNLQRVADDSSGNLRLQNADCCGTTFISCCVTSVTKNTSDGKTGTAWCSGWSTPMDWHVCGGTRRWVSPRLCCVVFLRTHKFSHNTAITIAGLIAEWCCCVILFNRTETTWPMRKCPVHCGTTTSWTSSKRNEDKSSSSGVYFSVTHLFFWFLQEDS